MTPYQEALLALAAESESAAIALWAQNLGEAEFAALLVASVARHNARAAMLAETAFSTEATVALRTPVPVIGLPIVDDTERLAKSAKTLADTARASDVPEKIVGRLGRAEPLNAAARTYSDAVRESTLTEGWVRGLDGDPCQLCRWWWRDGRVWPKAHPMPTHPGCACVPRPVWRSRIKETEFTKQRRAS